MSDILEHKAVGGDAAGNFKESKVKRDGKGRFSSRNMKGWKLSSQEKQDLAIDIFTSKEYGQPLIKLMTKAESQSPTGELEGEAWDQIKPTVLSVMNEASASGIGVSPDGSTRVEFYAPRNKVKIRYVPNSGGSVKHAEGGALTLDEGLIQKILALFDFELEHSEVGKELAEDILALAHYGVPGMKWGVKRSRSSKSSSAPASEDYIRAVAAKSKPPHALSNQEMDALIRRMDLEQRYTQAVARANVRPMTKGGHVKKFVSNLLLDIGKTEVTYIAKKAARLGTNKSPLGKSLGLDKVKGDKKSDKNKD